eukprot:759141-Hanusia_phi.AAC.4
MWSVVRSEGRRPGGTQLEENKEASYSGARGAAEDANLVEAADGLRLCWSFPETIVRSGDSGSSLALSSRRVAVPPQSQPESRQSMRPKHRLLLLPPRPHLEFCSACDTRVKNSSVGPRPVPASPKYSTSRIDLTHRLSKQSRER